MVDFPGFSLSGAVASFFLILLTMKRSDDFKVIGPAHPIVAKIGEDALLTCQLLPKRTAIHMEVRWYRSEPSTPVFTYRDGAEVTEMQSEEYRSRVEWIEDDTDKGSVALKIYNVQPSDHGQYWCHFQDGTYCAETSLQLKVAGLGSAPDIHMQGTVESRAQLVCTAEGWFPEPEVYWENTTGEKMLTFSEHHIQDEDGLFYVESTLVVRDASAETVSCVIHSPILSEEKGSAVSIPEKLQTELASLQVIGPSQPMLVRVGEDIQLTCYLSPKANAQSMEVRWLRAHRYPAVYVYKDGDHVAGEQMEEYKGRTVLVSDAIDEGRLTLQIHNARTSDDGQYRCLFEKDGVYQETSLDLKVAGMGSSPAITMKEWKDGEMQLICSSDGWFPQPHVQWRDTEGKTMPLFSEALTQGHHGLFHVETSLLVRNSSIVNVSCSISNSLLGQEETGTFSLSDFISESRMTYSWKILPVLVVLLLVGAVSLNRRKSSKKVNVTLDPNTAHPELILSEGNKCVTRGHAWQKLPGAPQRFDCLPCVLGQQGFKSGRWHWEVEVGDGTGWFLGVVRDDVMRKRFVSVSPENGFWAMGCYGNEYWAITSPPTLLSLNVAPGRVRISLDYVSGHLSFYDMTNKCPIYTFSKCSFSGTLHPLFILWSPDIDYPDIFPVSRVSFVTSTKKTTTLDSGNQDVIPSSSTFLLSPSARRGLTRSSQSQLKSALTSLRLQI